MSSAILEFHHAETVYDFAWFPWTADPSFSCFISTSRDYPIHLWDAFSGKIRCSYTAFNDKDEPSSAISVRFSPDGRKIFSGFDKHIRIFDTDVPGRSCVDLKTFERRRISQKGIISCFAFPPQSSVEKALFAAGSYSGSIGLYSSDSNELIQLLQVGPGQGGVTQLEYSPFGHVLFSGSRKSSHIVCWDVRNLSEPFQKLDRPVSTNQRILFDIHFSGSHLVSGSDRHGTSLYDLTFYEKKAELPDSRSLVHNSCQFHPFLPLILTSSGSRSFDLAVDSGSDAKDTKKVRRQPAELSQIDITRYPSSWRTLPAT